MIVSRNFLVRSGFELSIESNSRFDLVPLYIAPLFNESEVKSKPIATCSHASSRAWRRLHVFASSSDWSLGNLCLLRLASVSTLILVLRHLIEKRSIVQFWFLKIVSHI